MIFSINFVYTWTSDTFKSFRIHLYSCIFVQKYLVQSKYVSLNMYIFLFSVHCDYVLYNS